MLKKNLEPKDILSGKIQVYLSNFKIIWLKQQSKLKNNYKPIEFSIK